MRDTVAKNWSELSAIWPALFESNIHLTPYQSYEFLTLTGKGKPQRNEMLRLLGLRELNLVLYKDGEAIAIAPLLYKKGNKKYTVYMRGHFTIAHHLDFVYKPHWSYDDFKFLMDSVGNLLGNVSFWFDRVSEKSMTCGYMKKYFASGKIEKMECLSIPIPQNYDDWLGSLHKSVRRNMVTHRNRLDRDRVSWRADFYRGRQIDAETCKKMMLVYADRFLIKNKFRFGPLNGLVKRVLRSMLSRDKVTRLMNVSADSIHGIVYMNGEIAAFTSGLVCKDRRAILSRLAISTKFSKYGPGGVLISSAVQYAIEQNKNGNPGIEELDLSQGGQGGMSYKYAYGGQEHFNYQFMG